MNVKKAMRLMKNNIKVYDGGNNAFVEFEFYDQIFNLTKEARRRLLCFAYWRGGGHASQEAKYYFRDIDKPYLWDAEQKKAFAELPDPITLYRGVEKAEIDSAGLQPDGKTLINPSNLGISWTPIIRKARNYASYKDIYHSHNGSAITGVENPKDGYILQVIVPKKRLKTYYWFGRTKECVLLCNDKGKVTVVEKINDKTRKEIYFDSYGDDMVNFYRKFPNGIKDKNMTRKDMEDFFILLNQQDEDTMKNLQERIFDDIKRKNFNNWYDPERWI